MRWHKDKILIPVYRFLKKQYKFLNLKLYDIDELNGKVKKLKKDVKDYQEDGLVSIVLPVYNQFRIFKQCIYSIEKFTGYKNYEVIIINDASTEKGFEKFLKKLKENKRYKIIINKKNLGYPETVNKGIKTAKGKYVCLFNSDLIATDYWLSELVKVIRANKGIKIVGSKLLYPNGKIQHVGVSFGKRWVAGQFGIFPYHIYLGKPMGYEKTLTVKEYPAVTFACALIDKKALIDIGLLSEEYGIGSYEDVDVCMKFRQKGWKIMYCPTSVLYHYESIVQWGKKGFKKIEDKNAILFFDKWNRELEVIKA